MTSKEAALYQLKNLKGKPFKQKVEHIVTYFSTPILIVFLILSLGISYIVHLATLKDSALNIVCLNSYANTEETDCYALEFAQSVGINTNEYTVHITTGMIISENSPKDSYETAQAILAQAVAQSIDILAADLDTLTPYFYQEFFVDLRQILSSEQQVYLSKYFLYMDLAYLDQLHNTIDVIPEYPDPTKPEEMSQPVPVGLLLPLDSSFTHLCYNMLDTQPSVGIIVNSKNLDNTLSFINYIMD